MTVLIEAAGLTKRFGPILAVDGISLSVKQGEVLGFLGPNGAGKSTTMKMITGFLGPDAGSASICGFDIGQSPKEAKHRLGYLPEGAPAYGEMTARSYLSFVAEVRGARGAEIDRQIDGAVEKTALQSVLNQRVETLSKGFKRRVGLAAAILHDPPVLIMDEPTDGLDPNQKHHVRTLIREMAAKKAIIISTHILEEVEAVCSRAVVIDKGRIVADGTAEDLMRRADYHGAVAVRVPVKEAEKISKILAGAKDVERVETLSKVNSSAQLRVTPKTGKQIAADVAALLREKALPVDELYVERGKLDDVFRQITTSDQGGNHA
jgi:ABC-2 type transport system ATP-binding protein